MKSFCLFIAFCMFASFASAQSADFLSDILNSNKFTYKQAAYISSSQLGYIDEDDGYDEAVAALRKSATKVAGVSPNAAITVQDFAYICCKTWGINNSLSFRVVNSPRLALRQLKALRIIPTNYGAKKTLSGSEALAIVTRCIDYYEYEKRLKGNIYE